MAFALLTLLGFLQLFNHALCQSNEHPFFDEDTHTVNVFEGTNTSQPILTDLKASDFEEDPISYYIDPKNLGSDSFYIVGNESDSSFELYFKDSITLDREARDSYVVIVHAKDNQDHGAAEDESIKITVIIKDINDERPVFVNLPKTVNFSEFTTVGEEIYDVDATDDDIGRNAIIKYLISSVNPSSGKDKFEIYTSSGEIGLTEPLDYENETSFVITIIAQDLGIEPLSTSEQLTVVVIDGNDLPPQFFPTEYSEQIYENTTIGTSILRVSAKDQDIMIDDDIVYSIDSSLPVVNNTPLFVIDSGTGIISVNAKLDADQGSPSSYTFNVKGTEVSDSSKYDEATVTITVLDINDNPPKFEHSEYNASLSELSSIGTIAATVMAVDEDQGANAQFTFELINLTPSLDTLPFNITQSSDGETGHVQLTAGLDFETYEKYVFEVRATEVVNDKTKTASTTVTITVINVNDESPVFQNTNYLTDISENAKAGAYVGQVMASDEDKGEFGKVYYYLLNYKDTFEIDQTTGVITLEKEVDYEKMSNFFLLVGANDSAMPLSEQRMTSVQVQVNVLDANDNGPVISKNGSTSIKIEEEQEAGVLIYVVVADDVDDPPNDYLDYFIEVLEPSDLLKEHFEFSEDSRNQLVTKVPLDYEKIKQYKLRLYVTDLGDLVSDDDMESGLLSGLGIETEYESVTDLPSDHVDYIDLVINVIDENDNAPKFVGGVTDYSYDVDEEKPAHTFVGFANATDSDSGLFGTVRYSISGVDHENFTIDQVTGDIFTAGPINREQKDRFDLIVTARDLGNGTRLSASVDLTITINDINDHTPQFQQPIYVENDIVENSDSDSVSIQVSATDADINENADLTYEIVYGNSDNQFKIDSSSGLITLNSAVTLDREMNPKFNLIIQVTDGGVFPSPLSSNATVIIEIQDLNDNKPLFEETVYNVNITEGAQIGSQVVTVKANDKDIGPNGIVDYSLEDETNFAIDTTSGIITTKTSFDVDTQQNQYVLKVTARDRGVVTKSSEAQVVVKILDVNDNSPEFTKSQYTSQVSEDTAGETLITTIKATDKDSDELNRKITYTISNVTIIGSSTPSDANADETDGLFTLNPEDGKLYLSLNRSFDYESVTGYNVLVQAKDGGNPQRKDSSVVLVTISDYNDNRPTLSAKNYSLSLYEDTDEGTTYSLFSYEDIDSGMNAVAEYSLENTNVFSIDKDTGVLELESTLDYEKTQYFEFTVVVTDKGSPRLSSSAEVYITVSDVNDEAPDFVTPSVSIKLNESNYTAPMDIILYIFNATDQDDEQNGMVTYSITNGDNSLFWINSSSGEFRAIGNIDREDEDFYELTITATDGGSPALTDTSTISITVLDRNDNPPAFLADSYSKTISENNAVNVSLVTVAAEDPDFGENGKVYYSLNDTTNFMIKPDGEILARTEFNYEEIRNVLVLVTATDGVGLDASVIFTLYITDENDNKPEFITTYNDPIMILENETVGYLLASGKAIDVDSGASGDVTYQIAGAKGKFAIDSNGNITLQSSLDRENEDSYRLIITASDHGTPQKSSVLEINVTVGDVNDKDPMFGANFYSVVVPENESTLATIQIVDATDADVGKNAELAFEITEGNSDSVFSISTSYDATNKKYNGSIVLDKKLDFETTTSYSLKIVASDMGADNVRTSTAHVFINVQNINDEFPEFSPSNVYSFSVSEIAPDGTPVGTVLATDDDAGAFGKITSYEFAPNTPSDVTKNFELSSTGVITLASGSNIDFDSSNTSYAFSVVATDGGGLSSTASVTINVTGHNEEAPSFQKQSYNGSVYENLAAGQLIVMVKATDPDNSPITYQIVEGDNENRFRIDTSGRIETNEQLNREDKEVYILRIRASDNDPNPLYSYTQVEITVLDENDNVPKFPDDNVEYQLVETALPKTILSPVILATDADKDENAEITYSGGEPGVFSVNSTTGYISLLSELNYEEKSQYVFKIFSHDGGSPSKSDNITVKVSVLDFNDNEPQFEFNKYTKSIYENVTGGDPVITVFANDTDSGVNAEIVYSIDASDTFEIDSNGEITTKVSLDYETATQHVITVTATDKGNPPKSATSTVELNILDINDNGPEFEELVYTDNIKEQSVQNDLYVLSVSAIDRDGTSPNNIITYNITQGNDDLKFKIDQNGTIYAVEDLDREEESMYMLTVMAIDNPINPSDAISNTTKVTIYIDDVNDNSPVWSDTDTMSLVAPNQFAGKIVESASPGTLVVYVEATDEDSGSFGEVTYSILTISDKFYINETSGYVYTYGTLDSDVISFYNLTIVATDGGLKSTIGYLSIDVIDVNDKEPSFLSSFFYRSVSEGVDLSYSVATLTAFDQDSEDLEYSIIDGNSKGFFKINSSSGEVGLAKKLDREIEDDFLLEVFVSDGKSNDTAHLRIVVTDVNDNPPGFIDSPYFAYIDESAISGIGVLLYNSNGNTTRVQAFDPDEPDSPNSIVVYETFGANKDILNIAPSSGVLTVANGADLDYESDKTVIVKILAHDSVSPPGVMSSETTITIYVQDINDKHPVFAPTTYSSTLKEDEDIGTVVIDSIYAFDVDTGSGGIVTYSIVSANPSDHLDKFAINASTGVVTLAEELDREEASVIYLKINATDSSSPFNSVSAQLTVFVTDINDNSPVFNQSSYYKAVAEDIGMGKSLITVEANDEDENLNGDVVYSLLNYSDVFKINSDTGVLSTVSTLDHESKDLYTVIAQACDRGTPSRLCSNVTVTISVTDVNDITPSFDYDVYRNSICDDLTPVTDVLQVIAVDKDSRDYGKVTYSLASGSSLGSLFKLNKETGEITLVDYIQPSDIGTTLSVNIVAADGGTPSLTSETEVRITFCDRETSSIYFNESLYYGAVEENGAPPSYVTTLTAISSNPPVSYFILPPKVDNHFNISSTTGVIETSVMLDREERDMYSLVVKAVDSTNTTYTTITIAILDVNDHPPRFLPTPFYSFTLIEEQSPEVTVSTIVAIDPDQPFDPNGVTYSLDSSSNPDGIFSINENGTIYTNKPVDREKTQSFKLKIRATDVDPSDPRITTATATITILDINDNSPVFEPDSYNQSVSENHPPSFSVLKVTATDKDIDLNKEIEYSIVSGHKENFFIDPNSGVIKTLNQLDFEIDSIYNITVMARDKGTPSLNSSTSVMVMVEDYNDCTPMFTADKYTKVLPENQALGAILDIDATDCDSGDNKKITYSIVSGNNADRFELNPSSGELSLKNSLDYETETAYLIQIKATDGGTPALFNLTLVEIGVGDINDETPVFDEKDGYDLDIPEDRNVGYEIVVARATDKDESMVNSELEYSIISGDDNEDFRIDSSTGSVKIDKELDREKKDSYLITIEARDTGSPPRSANTTLSLTILDVNDNSPVIVNLPDGTEVAVFENATKTEVLYTVNATDKDINDNANLQYSLQNYEDVFSIHPSNGVVRLQSLAELDYDQSVTEYQLSIEVTDLAPLEEDRLTDHATLNIMVKDVNDHNPIFDKDHYEATNPEEQSPGQEFVTVRATDGDGTIENNKITYSIFECSPACDHSFEIDGSTGEITNSINLDRETNDHYELTVLAVNVGAYPERNDSCTVSIILTDINDHSPMFNQTSYQAAITEGVQPNTEVLSVFATDGDKPNTINSQVTYKILSVIPNNPFTLNENSGSLEITGSIDRESISFYNFTVRVEDNGETKLYNDAQVTISIGDENDQPPVFVKDLQSVRVNEGLSLLNLPYYLWSADYTDDDQLNDNRRSKYILLSVLNGSTPIGSSSSMILLNQTNGDIYLNSLVDFERTKNLTVLLSVNNTKDGVGELCGGFDKTCLLSATATLNVEITDYNDNTPIFTERRYTGQVSTTADPGTQIRQVLATDRDSQNNYGTVRYRLGEGSSSKFKVESETGYVVTRGTFENDDGRTFEIKIEAYDNLGENPSWVSTVNMEILALSDFKRVLILFNRPSTDFTEEKEKFIVDTLHNLTGYTIVVEDIRAHLTDDVGDVDPSKTDFIFHALNANGEIVDFNVFIENLNVELFFDLIRDCFPEKISSLQTQEDHPPTELIMRFLIGLCGIIVIGAIVVLILAAQQRYIALHSMWKSQVRDAFYGSGGPSLIDGAMPRDFSNETFEMRQVTKNQMYVEPYQNFGQFDSSAVGESSVGDLSSMQQDNPLYEEQEIRMDMFEPSDDETEGDFDGDNLLDEALKDNESDGGSVTAI